MSHRAGKARNSRLRIVANDGRAQDCIYSGSHAARRFHEIADRFCSDLRGGDHLSEAQKQLVRSATGLVVLRESLDAKINNGEPIDNREYCAVCDSLRRVLTAIGLQHASRDTTGGQTDAINRILRYIEEGES